MKAQKANTYLGIGFFIFGVVTWVVAGFEATGFTYMSISPEFFPRLLAVLVSFLAILLYIQAKRQNEQVDTEEGSFRIERKLLIKVIALTASAFLYVFLMQYFGYIITTISFLFLIMKYFYKVRLRTTLIIAILLPIVLNYAFRAGMNVVVPVGSIIENIIY